MSSIIPGYNYDIFISYRQKDNKGDRWVSEFVDALKTELESTFKEEISVYFDINPHDGLLETHDVDASLKDKLKCLIFIPIISRTYCDPNSFAWEHEFKAFIELASKDQYGLKVKLPGGNVARRLLPVQIHYLENEDKKLLEGELSGFLRGIEFIYKEPGVNRPLKPDDDEKINLNKTKYRNQINKVANAIKEIITGIRYTEQSPLGKIDENEAIENSPTKRKIKKLISVIAIIALIIVPGYYLIPGLRKPLPEIEKSIAVLPFKLLSNEPDKQYLADGMMDEITLHLSKIRELRVLGRTSTEQYRNPSKTTTSIGRELGVSYLLEGSFQKSGDSIRLIVQLIKTGKEGHVWAENYDRPWKNVFSVQSEVAQSIAKELNAAITTEVKQLIDKKPTTNLTAYDFYQRGMEEIKKYNLLTNIEPLKKAESLFNKAVELDSSFAQSYLGLAIVYWNKHGYKELYNENYLDSVLILSKRALSLNDKLGDAYVLRGEYYYQKGLVKNALRDYDEAIQINPNSWDAYNDKGDLYSETDLLESIINYQKAVSLNHGPNRPDILRNLAFEYDHAGFTDKAMSFNNEALSLDGDSVQYYLYMGIFEEDIGNYSKAVYYLQKSYQKDTLSGALYYLSQDYIKIREYQEALRYLNKYTTLLKKLGIVKSGNIYHRIGYALLKNGFKEKAELYFNLQIDFCEKDIKSGFPWASQSSYTYYDLAAIYAFRGEKEKAYKNLRIFNNGRQKIPLWFLTLIKDDPLLDNLRNEKEFIQIMDDIQFKYQAEHERVKKWIEENKML